MQIYNQMMATTSVGKLLDLQQGFDKLCRNGVFYNLRQKSILGILYKLFE